MPMRMSSEWVTLDAEHSDVSSRIRKDFDAAGVNQSDEQILRVMQEFMLKASAQTGKPGGGSVDAAEVMLKRRLTSRSLS